MKITKSIPVLLNIIIVGTLLSLSLYSYSTSYASIKSEATPLHQKPNPQLAQQSTQTLTQKGMYLTGMFVLEGQHMSF